MSFKSFADLHHSKLPLSSTNGNCRLCRYGKLVLQEGVPDAAQAMMSSSPRAARPSTCTSATFLDLGEDSTHHHAYEQTAVDLGMPPAVVAATSAGRRPPSRTSFPSAVHRSTSSHHATTTSSSSAAAASSSRQPSAIAAPRTPTAGTHTMDRSVSDEAGQTSDLGATVVDEPEPDATETMGSRELTSPQPAAALLPPPAENAPVRDKIEFLHQQLDGMCEEEPVLDGLELLGESDSAPRMQGGPLLHHCATPFAGDPWAYIEIGSNDDDQSRCIHPPKALYDTSWMTFRSSSCSNGKEHQQRARVCHEVFCEAPRL
jgi:hypothetical protein